MGGNDKLTINYAVCCNVFFPVTQSEKAKLETKRTWTVNQAVGPMLKFVPVLADKKHSFDILSESFQKGAKPIRMNVFRAALLRQPQGGRACSCLA